MQLITAVAPAKITLKKPYILFRKVSSPGKHRELTALNRNEDTSVQVSKLTSNQLSSDHCSNVIVLLYTVKTQRMQSFMGTLPWTALIRLSYRNFGRGESRTTVASRMKFFMTIINGWEPLAVNRSSYSCLRSTSALN